MVIWLKNNNLIKLMQTLGECMAVGGCVRNYMIAKLSNLPFDEFDDEVDLATPLLPEVVMDLAKKAGFKVIPTGLQHGTVTCVMNGDVFEVTTLRIDTETDGRHAIVQFSNSWEEDAKRRDLTMNALYADINGEIHDFVGGIDDIKIGRIRFIGDPDLRIQEDYLRILRFFRFFAHYGKTYDESSLIACKKYIKNLQSIARERCIAELMKLLSSPRENHCILTLKMMHEIDLWQYCDFPTVNLSQLQNSVQRSENLNLPLSPLAKLSTFQGDFTKLKISNKDKKHIQILQSLEPMVEKADYIKWINHAPKELWNDGFILQGQLNDLSFLEIWEKNLFKFSGRDVMQILHLESGPQIKIILDKLQIWFCEQHEPPSHDQMHQYLMKSPLLAK